MNLSDKLIHDFSSYHGPFVDGLPDGKGKLTWASGDVWNGEFKNGVIHGFGTFENTTNSNFVYKGNFVNGKFEGRGTCRLRQSTFFALLFS